jgi:hypothetical protein
LLWEKYTRGPFSSKTMSGASWLSLLSQLDRSLMQK